MRAELSIGPMEVWTSLTREPLMQVGHPGYLANFDSATAIVRALAHYVAGKDFPLLGAQPTWTAPGMKLRASTVNRMPRYLEELVRLLPHGQLVVIPEVAHTLVYTAPCELVRVTRPFLDEASEGSQKHLPEGGGG